MSKFKGYAQATGFKNTQLPDTTRRIREEGEDTIRRMERNFNVEQENTRLVLEAFNDKYRVEKENRDLVFNLETENRNRIRQQMVANAETDERNNQVRVQKSQETFAALASLSNTASTVSKQLFDDISERSKQRGVELGNIVALAGGSYAEIEYMRSVEQAHIKNDEKYNTILDKLIAGGAPNDIVEQIKSGNASTFYGLKKTMLVDAGNDYANALAADEAEELFYPDGRSTGVTLGAARTMDSSFQAAIDAQEIRNQAEYVAQFGGAKDPMVARYLYPKMVEIQRANERSQQADRAANLKTEIQLQRQQKWITTFEQGLSHQDGIAASWNLVKAHENKGVAREEWFAALSQMAEAGKFGSLTEGLQFYEDLLSFQISIDGKTSKSVGDLFGKSKNLLALKNAIISSAQRDDQLNQALKEDDAKRRGLELQTWIYKNSGTFDDDYVKDILTTAGNNGIISDESKALLFRHSADAPGRQRLIQELQQAERDGTLTLSDFSGVTDPQVLKFFESTRKRLADDVSNLRKQNSNVRSDFRKLLRTKLKTDPLASSANNFSLNKALDDLMRRYQQEMAKDTGGTITRDEQQEDIITRLAKEVQAAEGRYAIKPEYGANGETPPGVGAYFTNFDPSSSAYIPPALPSILPKEVIAEAKSNPEYLSTTKFISNGAARKYLNQIKQNNLNVIPPIFHQLSNVTAQPAHEILLKQIELQFPDQAKGLTINPDLYQNVMSSLGEGEASKALLSILTIPSSENLRTAQIAGGHKVHRVRTDEEGFIDVMSLARASNFRAPHVMAAIWANETRWGRSPSGKNNLFNIKSQDGSGTPRLVEEFDDQGNRYMEPSSFRDYDSPAQSAEDFINFISKYPGVAEANTPREMLQALQDGGYATSPTYADDVSRVVEDFVNPDAPFIPYDGPAATDPNYQSATLQHIYNTNTLGFGSTGPHTDVKQLDNLRTPDVDESYTDFDPYDKELGEYLLIDDDEYGEKVPIHRPGYSDGFQQHLNRGSRGGYDYLHHLNTPVYIKPPAKVVHSSRQDGTDILIVELPSGRRFQLIHGLKPSRQ